MIKLTGLTKQYSNLVAVKSIDLKIKAGEVFGFLGPNGAGKTTTIKMMAGLLQPTGGRVEIGGFDVQKEPLKAKAITGFIPDRPYLYEKLTAREFMRFVAELYTMTGADGRIDELLALFGLIDWAGELVENFSHGMKQRLVMASSLLHHPKVLVVDEPMVGLDPRGARLIKDVFRRMSERGVAILMSTHTLEVAQEMCHRLSIINRGRIIAHGTVDEVRAMAGGEDDHLTSVFLKLTGGSGLQEIDEIV